MIEFIKGPENLKFAEIDQTNSRENRHFREDSMHSPVIRPFSRSKIVIPGEFITDDPQFMRFLNNWIFDELIDLFPLQRAWDIC